MAFPAVEMGCGSNLIVVDNVAISNGSFFSFAGHAPLALRGSLSRCVRFHSLLEGLDRHAASEDTPSCGMARQ